jgi:hypothetical protein
MVIRLLARVHPAGQRLPNFHTAQLLQSQVIMLERWPA